MKPRRWKLTTRPRMYGKRRAQVEGLAMAALTGQSIAALPPDADHEQRQEAAEADVVVLGERAEDIVREAREVAGC